MALYIPHSIFHLARLLYVSPETFGPYYVYTLCNMMHGAYNVKNVRQFVNDTTLVLCIVAYSIY